MKILFFDGECNLCNGIVNSLIRLDRRRRLRFASLQGKNAQSTLPRELVAGPGLPSVVYRREGEVFVRSTAALLAISDMGGGWIAVKAFFVIPAFLRDFLYDLLAANRYRLFGKRDSCRVPLPEERALFLD